MIGQRDFPAELAGIFGRSGGLRLDCWRVRGSYLGKLLHQAPDGQRRLLRLGTLPLLLTILIDPPAFCHPCAVPIRVPLQVEGLAAVRVPRCRCPVPTVITSRHHLQVESRHRDRTVNAKGPYFPVFSREVGAFNVLLGGDGGI